MYHNIGYKLGRWHDSAWLQRDLYQPLRAASDPVQDSGEDDATAGGRAEHPPSPTPAPARLFSTLAADELAACIELGQTWLR